MRASGNAMGERLSESTWWGHVNITGCLGFTIYLLIFVWDGESRENLGQEKNKI